MLGVIVVSLRFDARVFCLHDFDRETLFLRGIFHQFSQLTYRKLLRKLIEHTVLAWSWRITYSELDATHCIPDIQKTSGLTALAVNGQGMLDYRLHAETVQYRSPNSVIIETRCLPFIERGLVGLDTVDDSLVQIGGAQAPIPACEHDIVRVVNLRKVVKGTRLFGIWKHVLASVVNNFDKSLFDIDIWRAIFSHRAKFDQMTLRTVLFHGEKQIQGADDIVHLRKYGVVAVDHRKRSTWLFAVMHDGIRPE